jgi:hypothetical protein
MRPLYVSHASFTKWVLVASVYRKGGCYFNHWVTSMPRSAFEGLEPCEVKVSRRVLRGLGVSDDPRLPGFRQFCRFDNSIAGFCFTCRWLVYTAFLVETPYHFSEISI